MITDAPVRFWLIGLVAAGCIKSSSVPCGDRVCPSGTVCVTESLTCIAEAAETVCEVENIAEGDVCDGASFVGICKTGLCLPGCGDGVIFQASEECDDGNFRSHDGCSSICTTEIASWREMHSPWTGLFSHVAGYHRANDFMIVLSGESLTGLRTGLWAARAGTPSWFDLERLNQQAQLPPPVIPPARTGATMAYDGVRQKLVLFGGHAQAGYLNDTWEWSYAEGWIQRTNLAMSPSARSGARMVFDTTAGRIVLFGGQTATSVAGDTWEYDGGTWTRTATTGPAGRYQHGLAYDDANNRTVLFGGIDAASVRGDTWHYNAGTWQPASPSASPPIRFSHAMEFAPDRQTVIVFGGLAEVGADVITTNDTWEYAGGTWSQLRSIQTPPPRNRGTLTAVPQPSGSTQLVLIGGAQGAGKEPLSDIWRLGPAGQWIDISPQFLPPARYGAPASYDPDRNQLHILGGTTGATNRDDAWSFDSGWGRRPEGHPFRYFHTLAYDPKRKVTVMFGGDDATTARRTETYEYDGNNAFVWTQRSPLMSPPGRESGVLAYDGDALVLFGGIIAGQPLRDGTWTYDGTTWTPEVSPAGPSPAPSSQAAAAYDPVHDRMVLFDAQGVTWSHRDGAWERLVDARFDTPPARDFASMTFDWQTKRMLLIGGLAERHFTDVWELDGSTWRVLDVPGGGPLPRVLFGLASHAYQRETVLVGGAGPGFVSYGDVWTLQYRSQAAKDEVCNNGMDDDDDLHIDRDDPDCCAYDVPITCLQR